MFLLCAGIVGYRALRQASLPPGGRLGIYGFGASAHVIAQLASAQGATVHVLTRSEQARRSRPGRRGGSRPWRDLAIAGIHLSDIPALRYERELFYERNLRSVTANTRADGEEFLRLAGRLGVRPTVQEFPLSAAADALTALAEDRITGAAVLVP